MIGRITGRLIEKNPPHLLVEVGGLGYELQAPMSTFYQLPEAGQTVTLFTHLQVREDAHTLYGFVSGMDRELFRTLIRISGVGAKMALAILSGMEAGVFQRCVHEGDTAALVRLPGIGRKTAERLVVEMRGRLEGKPGLQPATAAVSVVDPLEDARQALISLGYRPQEAQRMVKGIEASGRSSEDIIRQALRESLS